MEECKPVVAFPSALRTARVFVAMSLMMLGVALPGQLHSGAARVVGGSNAALRTE